MQSSLLAQRHSSHLDGHRALVHVPSPALHHVTRRKAPTSRSAGATAVQQVSAQERTYGSSDSPGRDGSSGVARGPGSQALSIADLSQQLQVNLAVVQHLADRQPQLFKANQCASPQLVTQIRKLQQSLQLEMQQVCCMVTRQPALLTTSTTALLSQLKSAAHMLGLDHPIWFSLVAKQPELLEVPPARLALRATQLATLLQLPTRGKARAGTAQPQQLQHLLTLNDDSSLVLQRSERSEMDKEIKQWAVPDLAVSKHMQGGTRGNTSVASPVQHKQPANLHQLHHHSPQGEGPGTWHSPPHMNGSATALPSTTSTPHHPTAAPRVTAASASQSLPLTKAPAPTNSSSSGGGGNGVGGGNGPHSAALVSGLEVLTRLPPHDFFNLVSLPGDALVQRLLAVEAALQLGNPADSRTMVARCPQLLTQPLRATLDAWRALHAGPLHGVAPGTAQRWITRNPSLLCIPGRQLLASFHTVQVELGLTPAQAGKRVQQQPNLLKWAPDEFVGKLDTLGGLLGVTGFEARRMVRGAPGMMAHAVEVLADKRNRLADLLEIEPHQATQLLLQQPSLLTNSSNSLAVKRKQLSQLLPLPPAELRQLLIACPTLLTCSPKSVAAKAETLSRVLGWSNVELRHVLATWPELLAVPSAWVNQQVEEMCVLLGLDGRSRVFVLKLAAAWPQCIAGGLSAQEVVGGVRFLAQHVEHKQRSRAAGSVRSSTAQSVLSPDSHVHDSANAAAPDPRLGQAGDEEHDPDEDEHRVVSDLGLVRRRRGRANAQHAQHDAQQYVFTALRLAAKAPELMESAVTKYQAGAARVGIAGPEEG